MVMIKKANAGILNKWPRKLGIDGDNIILVELGNKSLHVRKCSAGTFCGKDCYEKKLHKKSRGWMDTNRDKICKHCFVYLDTAIKQQRFEDGQK